MPYENELYHHGIKGQKWGVRRYQDRNGRLTSAGRNRFKERVNRLRNLTPEQKQAIALRVGSAAILGMSFVGAISTGNILASVITGSQLGLTGFQAVSSSLSSPVSTIIEKRIPETVITEDVITEDIIRG